MEHKSVAKIISWNIDCEAICASAAKISTTSGNAIEIFEKCKSNPQNTDLVKKVLQSGHRSVIEHAVFSIAFWDVSAFVEQFLIECRLASFTVKSRRYVNFSNLGYFVPPALSGKSLHLYCEYMDLLFSGYRSLLESGIPKEDARFLLPYSFCSNFYCTINARELINLISSIIYGRGQNVPELQDIARQLILQIGDIFPVLLSELDCQAGAPRHNCETLPFILSKSLEFVYAEDAGSVQLLQAPLHPADILKHAFSCMRPYSNSEFNIGQIVASDRPRELEQLSYEEMLSLKKHIESVLAECLGLDCVTFEHGTSNPFSKGANSVDHVHIHIVPFERPIWQDIVSTISPLSIKDIDNYERLYQEWQSIHPDSYLLFQDTNQKIYYIPDASNMPSQLFRKCLAPHLAAPCWNWKNEAYIDNMMRTMALFKRNG